MKLHEMAVKGVREVDQQVNQFTLLFMTTRNNEDLHLFPRLMLPDYA